MAAGDAYTQSFQFPRQADQDFVAVEMTVTVIYLLEAVDIHQED